MGCDIHAYIEYKPKESKDWRSFSGQIHLDRNYHMFGLMADGVRGGGGFPLKGVPKDMSWRAEGDYHLYVDDKFSKESGFCGSQSAEMWIKEGWSEPVYNSEGGLYKVTNPEWHSASWLTVDEYQECINSMKTAGASAESIIEYIAALMCMKTFHTAEFDTRIVFWFDN